LDLISSCNLVMTPINTAFSKLISFFSNIKRFAQR
jgi:hypothetical protein